MAMLWTQPRHAAYQGGVSQQQANWWATQHNAAPARDPLAHHFQGHLQPPQSHTLPSRQVFDGFGGSSFLGSEPPQLGGGSSITRTPPLPRAGGGMPAPDVPRLGRDLLLRVEVEARQRGVPAAYVIFQEAHAATHEAALSRRRLFPALARLAQRHNLVNVVDPRERELLDLTSEAIFRCATRDGERVAEADLERLVVEMCGLGTRASGPPATAPGGGGAPSIFRQPSPPRSATRAIDGGRNPRHAEFRAGDTIAARFLTAQPGGGHRLSAVPCAAKVLRVVDDSRLEVSFTCGVHQVIQVDWVEEVYPGGARQRELGTPVPDARADSPAEAVEPEGYMSSFMNWFAGTSAPTVPEPVRPPALAPTSPTAFGIVGLENLGNSCYMNSLIQCLTGAPMLGDYFVQTRMFQAELNPENVLGSGGEVALEFAKVMEALLGGRQQAAFAPSALRDAVVRRSPELLGGMGQQDAQEFAVALLDCLHEDLNRVRGPKPAVTFPDLTEDVLRRQGEERAAAQSWSLCLQRDQSVIVDTFQGQLRSRISCLRCGFRRTKFEAFLYLSLPVVDSGGMPLASLGACLREFGREEHLCGSEQWYCQSCSTHCDAVKKIDLWKVPPTLLVHLKRFRYEAASPMRLSYAHGGAPPTTRKLGHAVDFGLRGLDLRALGAVPMGSPQRAEPTYDLCGAVDHWGSAGFGHYTACVQHYETGQWHRFDDSVVTPVSPSEVPSENGYLLLFRRRDSAVHKQSPREPEAWPHVF